MSDLPLYIVFMNLICPFLRLHNKPIMTFFFFFSSLQLVCVSTQAGKLPGPEWDLPIRVWVPNRVWVFLFRSIRVLYRILMRPSWDSTCFAMEHNLVATDRVRALFSACSSIVRVIYLPGLERYLTIPEQSLRRWS